MAPCCRVVYFLLKSPLEVRDTLGAASKSHLLAEVVPSFTTDAALPAWNPDFESDPIADGETSDFGPDGRDDARGLMAQRQGCTGAEVAIGELLVIAHIGAADACGSDLDL